MRGRKPKPTLIRQLEGNPGKRPLNDREPIPPSGVPECPDILDDDGRAEWFRTAAVLSEMGLLSKADRSALVAQAQRKVVPGTPRMTPDFSGVISSGSRMSLI